MTKRRPLLIEFPLPIRTERLEMRHVMPGDGALLNAAVVESWEVLSKWMEWATVLPSVEDTEEAMRNLYAQFILRKACSCKIFYRDEFVGMCGLHTIDWSNESARVGYWVRKSKQKNGFITEATYAFVVYGFKELKLKRIDLLCDDENVASAAVAERLTFKLDRKKLGLIHPLPNVPGERIGRMYVCDNVGQLPKWKVSW
jgi:ribosomal-protein-serine acetyltransferase